MRNLVLLLASGHTVRIALRDDDLPKIDYDPTDVFVTNLPAMAVSPFGKEDAGAVAMAYIEDPSLPKMLETGGGFEPPNDFQRITAEGTGTMVQYG